MRDLLIILDSVRYDRFMEATHELKRGRVYKAYAHGRWTRPSVSSMLSGYLPQSEYGQPYVPCWVMLDSFMFHNQEVPAWFLNNNAWMHNMEPRSYIEKWYPDLCSACDMVIEALKIMNSGSGFFVAILLTETHVPYKFDLEEDPKLFMKLCESYNKGEDNDAPQVAAERQRRAIAYLDTVLKPLLDIPDKVIVTSDHGDLQGENHRIGHDPSFEFDIKLLEVPLVIKEN